MKRKNLIFNALLGGGFYLMMFVGSAEAVCSLRSTSMAFGTYDVLVATPLDTTGSIVYRCGPLDFLIRITLDRGGAPSFATRRMLNGSEQLSYNLYLNAARTIIWGNGSDGTQSYFILNPQPNNQDITIPIYGRIPARQDRRVGAYTNTIIVTLNF